MRPATAIINFIIFLSIFILLYASLHFYFYIKCVKSFRFFELHRLWFIFTLSLLLLSPILLNLFQNYKIGVFGYSLSYLGYLWMAFIFLFFSIQVCFDLLAGLLAFIGSRIHLSIFSIKWFTGHPPVFFLTLFLIFVVLVYGHFEVRSIRIEKISLEFDCMPQEMRKFRIVQISDIHFSIINKKELAEKIVRQINQLEPDLVVCTGDLIDRDLQDEEAVIARLNAVKARYGKYAVTGNHEFYTGIEKATAFTTQAGFKMIRNQVIPVTGWMNLIGVDDPAGRSFHPASYLREDELLKNIPSGKMNILLKHQPIVNPNSRDLFTLQLSGHIHKGQIFPFSLITALLYRYPSGYFELSPKSHLYVSRGTGTWGPPIRFLAPPEITVIEIVNKQP